MRDNDEESRMRRAGYWFGYYVAGPLLGIVALLAVAGFAAAAAAAFQAAIQ
jgi:hypothetical protein